MDDRHLRLHYKGGRCEVCGRSVKAVERRFMTSKGTFDFNHIDPKQKSPSYKALMKRVLSKEQLDELDKCNLLCRICHGVWTNQQLSGDVTVTLQLPDGRTVLRKFPFHGMMEINNGKPRFYAFSDMPTYLTTYQYQIGNDEIRFLIGFELQGELDNLILATRQGDVLKICDAKGIVFMAERVDAEHVGIMYLVRFPFFAAEFREDQRNGRRVWARNGKVITEGEGVQKGGTIRGTIGYTFFEEMVSIKSKRTAAVDQT
jgi:hypothetical protein